MNKSKKLGNICALLLVFSIVLVACGKNGTSRDGFTVMQNDGWEINRFEFFKGGNYRAQTIDNQNKKKVGEPIEEYVVEGKYKENKKGTRMTLKATRGVYTAFNSSDEFKNNVVGQYYRLPHGIAVNYKVNIKMKNGVPVGIVDDKAKLKKTNYTISSVEDAYRRAKRGYDKVYKKLFANRLVASTDNSNEEYVLSLNPKYHPTMGALNKFELNYFKKGRLSDTQYASGTFSYNVRDKTLHLKIDDRSEYTHGVSGFNLQKQEYYVAEQQAPEMDKFASRNVFKDKNMILHFSTTKGRILDSKQLSFKAMKQYDTFLKQMKDGYIAGQASEDNSNTDDSESNTGNSASTSDNSTSALLDSISGEYEEDSSTVSGRGPMTSEFGRNENGVYWSSGYQDESAYIYEAWITNVSLQQTDSDGTKEYELHCVGNENSAKYTMEVKVQPDSSYYVDIDDSADGIHYHGKFNQE